VIRAVDALRRSSVGDCPYAGAISSARILSSSECPASATGCGLPETNGRLQADLCVGHDIQQSCGHRQNRIEPSVLTLTIAFVPSACSMTRTTGG